MLSWLALLARSDAAKDVEIRVTRSPCDAAPTPEVTHGALADGTGNDFKVFALTLQYGRPWLRASVSYATATDSFACHCLVLGLPAGL